MILPPCIRRAKFMALLMTRIITSAFLEFVMAVPPALFGQSPPEAGGSAACRCDDDESTARITIPAIDGRRGGRAW
jgi:hypothetical protein